MLLRHPALGADQVFDADTESVSGWFERGWVSAEEPHPGDADRPVKDSDPPAPITPQSARPRAKVKE